MNVFGVVAVATFLAFAVWSAALAIRAIRAREDIRWSVWALLACGIELLIVLTMD